MTSGRRGAGACAHAQSCPTLCDPMDCSPPGSSVHGILQARILERVDISSSRGLSWPRDRTLITCVSSISCIGRQSLYHGALGKPLERQEVELIIDHAHMVTPPLKSSKWQGLGSFWVDKLKVPGGWLPWRGHGSLRVHTHIHTHVRTHTISSIWLSLTLCPLS